MYDLILRDATIVSSAGREVADVAIADGRIKYVGPRPPRRDTKVEISAIGKFLMPGVIDTAVQFDPNGDGADWETESRAAATGGVTTVVSLPGGARPVRDRESARAHVERVKRSWVNYALWGGAHNGNAAELSKAVEEGLVVGALAYIGDAKNSGIGIEVDELPRFIDTKGILGVQINRDVHAVLDFARTFERDMHLVHLSTANELQLLDPVRGNLPVTAGVTPHHLFLSEDDDDQVSTSPPVRPEHDRRTLWTAVKRGRLDCVASDHHPSRNGSALGIPGSELMFPLMLSAVKYGRLSLELLVSLCSEKPARIFGLSNKGRIERGADADLILFAEGEVTKVDTGTLMSGAGWSPYAKREAAPKPDLVIVNGQVVARNGRLVADEPSGTMITHNLLN
jgi:dihydroorotase-like cyclic amidohydrolase